MNTQEFRSQVAIFAANNSPEVVLKTLAQVLGTIAAHMDAEFDISDNEEGWSVTVSLDDGATKQEDPIILDNGAELHFIETNYHAIQGYDIESQEDAPLDNLVSCKHCGEDCIYPNEVCNTCAEQEAIDNDPHCGDPRFMPF